MDKLELIKVRLESLMHLVEEYEHEMDQKIGEAKPNRWIKTKSEVARYLGISRQTLYRQIKDPDHPMYWKDEGFKETELDTLTKRLKNEQYN